MLQTLLCFVIFACANNTNSHPAQQVKQVVIWGHKLHSHTHSYIHWGFYRAFKHLGYQTYWLDARDNVSAYNFDNTLFITEGQVDRAIPINNSSYYIIHNCKPDKYRHLLANGHAIILQVYTHDCLDRKETAFSQCFHYDLNQPIIYMPWATDLLPHEIDAVKEKLKTGITKNNLASFVGSMSTGIYGNKNQIQAFSRAVQEHGITFKHGGVNSRSMEDNIRIVQEALLAPALQGSWQCEKGYIPCRIFKNISYGAIGITNSKTVYELFDKKIIYAANCYQLGKLSVQALKEWTIEKQFELMDIVRNEHTYIKRIEQLFSFFDMATKHKLGV